MNTTNLTINEIRDFLKGVNTLEVKTGATISEKYTWIQNTLTKTRYLLLRRSDKSVVRQFLTRCTGYSLSHCDHLIADFRQTGLVTRQVRDCDTEYQRFYTNADIVLLAKTSEAYFHPNGNALKAVLNDMYHVYGDTRFERLSHLSVSRLYDFRQTTTYQNEVLTYTKKKSVRTPIGERRKPYPSGRPGYLRVDSVHQGDLDKQKGVYHIHLVDEVTQFDVQLATAGISEYFLLPLLEEALSLFPFKIQNFHSDNGGEYINKTVAALLNKLMITQTKSRSRQTTDNALVEGKHAATIRPVYGRAYIPGMYAQVINDFNRQHLIPFLNYHRKCAFPTEVMTEQGKLMKVYRDYHTPIEKLLLIPQVEQYLIEGMTVSQLREVQASQSHLKAAEAMQKARTKLFNSFKRC